jgi:hypothetical protein
VRENAKANKLIVEKYLVYLIDKLANTKIKNKDTEEHLIVPRLFIIKKL